MGSGSSAEKKLENAVNKIAVANALSANSKGNNSSQNRRKSREAVFDFVRARKAEKEADWSDINSSGGAGNRSRIMNPIYDYRGEVEIDCVCPICRKPTMVGVNGLECRVCSRLYHKKCLEKSGRYTDEELKLTSRAGTTVGWSCHECDNICNLLSPDEMGRLSDEFESLDVNKDSTVNEEEFLQIRKRQYEQEEGTPMPEFEINFEKIQFRSLDGDRSGSVDYWEFMKHQASRKLGLKDKEELVKLLSKAEKKAARKFYETFDTDGDGVVYEMEAKMVLRSFYSSLEKRVGDIADKDGTIRAHTDSANVDKQTALRADLLMDGDEDGDNILTWEEFLRNQAIYIISSRPNKANTVS